jgi:hypothetical protein
MENDSRTLELVRARVEAQYREALRAIELLSHYLEENPKKIGENGAASQLLRGGIQAGSRRERIAEVITEFKTVPEIAEETGLNEPQVRGCLYSKDFSKKVERRRIHKKVRFRLKAVGA